MLLYFEILTILPILNLGSSSLTFLQELTYVLHFASTGVILIVLRYVLLYLLTILSNLLIYTFYDIDVMYL